MRTKKISKVLISQVPETLELNDLTIDKRHLKSTKIKLYKIPRNMWFLAIYTKTKVYFIDSNKI